MLYRHKSGISLYKAGLTDAGFLFRLKQESWWGTHHVAMINKQDQEKWLCELGPTSLCLIVSTRGRSIGCCLIDQIDPIARTARIGGAVTVEERSPEINRAVFETGVDFAFEMLNLHRLDAEVAAYNQPARKLEIDHLGFAVEGRRRQAIYKCGSYHDSLVLGMLRSEWEKDPRVVAMGGSCCENFDARLTKRMTERADR